MPLTNVWRPFNDEWIKATPKESGAYELGYKGTVVYIGSSEASIQSRLRAHRKAKKFMKVTDFRFKRTSVREARNLEASLCINFVRRYGQLPRLQEVAPKKAKSIIDRLLYG